MYLSIIVFRYHRVLISSPKISTHLRFLNAVQKTAEGLQRTQDAATTVCRIQERFDKFAQILTNPNDTSSTQTTHKRGVDVTGQEPTMQMTFHDRDNSVNKISRMLWDSESEQICILGPVGVGKTSLALAVVESLVIQTKYASRCFWVPCAEATSPIIFLQLFCTHLGIRRSTDDILQDILAEFNKSTEPRLILLDNFETVWNLVDDTTQVVVKKILRQLSQCRNISILVTMRGVKTPCEEIPWKEVRVEVSDVETSRSIFYDFYPNTKGDPDVVELLSTVGPIPFAVMSVAVVGRKRSLPAKAFLEAWQKASSQTLSDSVSSEQNSYQCISLCLEQDIVQQDPDALLLLHTLSLLPAGTSRENLCWWAPRLEPTTAITTLIDAALLVIKDSGDSPEPTILFVPPIVRTLISSRGIPENARRQVQEATCQYVAFHAHRYYDPEFQQCVTAFSAEDVNIQSVLLDSTYRDALIPSEQVVEALLKYLWYRYDTNKPSTELAERVVEFAISINNARYTAEAFAILGGAYLKLDNHHLAEDNLTIACQRFDELSLDGDISEVATECRLLLADSKILKLTKMLSAPPLF
jgi:GTPase SAR1 family protein